VLIACFEVPGWGGASTATYALFERLQADGLDVVLVNLVAEHDRPYFNYRFGNSVGNPRGLRNVHNCYLSGNNYRAHPLLQKLIGAVGPDLLVGVGWIAAFALGAADPGRKLIYVTTGCGWMGSYCELRRANDFRSVSRYELENPRAITRDDELEERAIEMADLVVAHSDANHWLHRNLYPGYAGKLYSRVIWFSEWIYADALAHAALQQPFHARDIDLLLVANDWGRAAKGFRLARQLIGRLKGLAVHVVGELPSPLHGATHHDFISERGELFRLLGNTRTVACTSAYDAAPGILFEAAAMGCNVVASRNCGNWELCHPELLAEPPTVAQFARCVRLAAARPFAHDISRFNGENSYDDLRTLLTVF